MIHLICAVDPSPIRETAMWLAKKQSSAHSFGVTCSNSAIITIDLKGLFALGSDIVLPEFFLL